MSFAILPGHVVTYVPLSSLITFDLRCHFSACRLTDLGIWATSRQLPWGWTKPRANSVILFVRLVTQSHCHVFSCDGDRKQRGMSVAVADICLSVAGMIKVILAATREEQGGKLCEWLVSTYSSNCLPT